MRNALHTMHILAGKSSLFAFVSACILLITVLGVCLTPTFTHAQLAIPGAGGTQIELEPRFPRPGAPFTARLLDFSGGGTPTEVIWIVDGSAVEGGQNQSVVSLTATELGMPMRIEARGDGGVSAKITVVPSALDIVVEGDTMAPYFYQGRRVPSSGSAARISAIPHLYTSAGKRIATSDLMFHWSINNVIVAEGRGVDAFSHTLPNIGESNIALTVEALDGSAALDTVTRMSLTEPSLQFYQYNPLSGLSQNAIQGAYLRVDGEVTLRAEPYFISRDVYTNAQYGWALNEESLPNGTGDPQVLTLQKSGEGGVTTVSFSLQNLSALAQYVAGLFQIEFN